MSQALVHPLLLLAKQACKCAWEWRWTSCGEWNLTNKTINVSIHSIEKQISYIYIFFNFYIANMFPTSAIICMVAVMRTGQLFPLFFNGVLNPTGLRPVHCKYCMLPPFLSICIAVSMSLDDSFFPLPCKVILTYSSVCLSLWLTPVTFLSNKFSLLPSLLQEVPEVHIYVHNDNIYNILIIKVVSGLCDRPTYTSFCR